MSPFAHTARNTCELLLKGEGRFLEDLQVVGLHFAVFVRSLHAQAKILSVDSLLAEQVPDVLGVLTARELGALRMPIANSLLPIFGPQAFSLIAGSEVSYAGQPIAMVIAKTLEAAQSASELVEVEYEVTALPRSELDQTEAKHVLVRAKFGQTLSEARRTAANIVRIEHEQARVIAMSLEPRAALAQWDTTSAHLCTWLPTQTPSRARKDIAEACGLNLTQVRVIAPDVGGAFGAKASVYPEDLLVAFAARHFKTSVRWIATRSEEFVSAMHGRGASMQGELHLGDNGQFQHLQARLQFPLGAWLAYSAVVPLRNATRILPGPYLLQSVDIEGAAEIEARAAVNIYRGAGRPEAALLMERLIDAAAQQTGIDPIALRRRNLIPKEAMPFRTATGETLDSGDYLALLNRACERFGYEAERATQATRRAAGEWVGIGVACYLEPCGQGWEGASVTLAEDGSVLVASGSPSQGQGHQLSFARIAAEELACPVEKVTVIAGDTDTAPEGIGALASRSTAIGGSAVLQAAREVRARQIAGEALPITVSNRYSAPLEAWSSGCVFTRMRIDADTGQPSIERIVWVDDAGRIISPELVEGQLLGGLAQGLGQAMMERLHYDTQGQLITGSLMDYAVPRADDMPTIEIESLPSHTQANLLGAKGVGEAGCIGVPAALLNAAVDALSPFAKIPEGWDDQSMSLLNSLNFPLTSERLWQLMEKLKR